eukprot:44880-Amphidinium_carterae.2
MALRTTSHRLCYKNDEAHFQEVKKVGGLRARALPTDSDLLSPFEIISVVLALQSSKGVTGVSSVYLRQRFGLGPPLTSIQRLRGNLSHTAAPQDSAPASSKISIASLISGQSADKRDEG